MRITGTAATLGLLLGAAACDETPVSLRQPAGVAVAQTTLSMMVGDQAPVTAQVVDQAGRVIPGLTPAYGTDNAAVATVTAAGMVEAMMPGKATITAMYGGSRATVDVTVTPDLRNAVQRVEMQADSLVVDARVNVMGVSVRAFNGLGQPMCPQFAVRSSDRSVATARMSGSCRIELALVFSGETTITAEAEGVADSMRVRVTRMGTAAFFSARPTSEELVAGATVRYTVSVRDQADRPVPNVDVNFEVSVGTLAANTVRTGTDGTATMQWTIPTHLARLGQTHNVSFRAEPHAGASHAANEIVYIDGTSLAAVRLYTGLDAYSLRVLEGDSIIRTPGGTQNIGAVGEDPYGNIRNTDFTWSVTAPGRFTCGSAGTRTSAGVEYVCVLSSVPGAVTVTATAPGGLQRAVTVLYRSP